MATLSACLIVKNESNVIARCIESISPCVDEIVIYDTGSDDGTQDICKKYDKVKLTQGYWDMNFSRARNESFKLGSMDYLMWVDADDILEEDTINWIIDAKKRDFDGYEGITMNYVTSVDNNNKPTFYYVRTRIVKRLSNPKWSGEIHETLSFTGKTKNVSLEDARFIHKPLKKNDPKRNYNIFKKMEKKHKGNLSTRDWFYYARESEWHDTKENAIKRYKKALSDNNMWKIDRLNAYISLSKIYEKTNKRLSYEYAYMAVPLLPIPRCDVCCRLGDLYLADKNYKMAKMWYDLALDNITTGIDNTFCDIKYATSYPRIQLCVAEYWLGNVDKAIEYNEEYGKLVPNSKSYLYNKNFFETKEK